MDESDVSAKICKNDTMYHANDYYMILKKEASRNNLYTPYYQVVEPFYKKSKSDNGDTTKAKKANTTDAAPS